MTASYQNRDLEGIHLAGNLEHINLAGQNLVHATFSGFLDHARFNQANLANAVFDGANLTGADLSQANLLGARITYFDAIDLSGVSLRHANLTDVYFRATLPSTDLTNSDARGAQGLDLLPSTITANLIRPDGHIAGFDLTGGGLLVVRDYDGNSTAVPPTDPLPIVVEQHAVLDTTSLLRITIDADAWNSTISFAPGISVALGGTLELSFAPDVNVATQIGRTIDLFDWSGVEATGAFTVSSPYTWNLADLYTTGEVTLTALGTTIPGDFNLDGTVDAADYTVWRDGLGTVYTAADYEIWREHFGHGTGGGTLGDNLTNVPEPATLGMLVLLVTCLYGRRMWI